MRRLVATVGLAAIAACAARPARPQASISFERAIVWLRQGQDSVRLGVELAESPEQHQIGLSGRATLDPEAGMLFVFDAQRYGGDGFQMWRTRIPLDIAFIDTHGAILRIMTMEPCAEARVEWCPGYYPGTEYVTALEVNRGWFAEKGIGVGAVVRVER
jgi:uncharacterized membrane protein (UPF0127 family)